MPTGAKEVGDRAGEGKVPMNEYERACAYLEAEEARKKLEPPPPEMPSAKKSGVQSLPHRRLAARGDGRDALRILQLTDIHQFPLGATEWHLKGPSKAPGIFAQAWAGVDVLKVWRALLLHRRCCRRCCRRCRRCARCC
jgi:hypothetical protein